MENIETDVWVQRVWLDIFISSWNDIMIFYFIMFIKFLIGFLQVAMKFHLQMETLFFTSMFVEE